MPGSKGWFGGSRLLAAIAVTLFLAACTAGGIGGGGPAKVEYQASDFLKTGYCPPLLVRGGTAALAVYERGHDNEPAFVRYQASIGRTARECQTAGTMLSAKVGISGRVVGGPKVASGTVTLPIRVVVVRQMDGAKPLYSQLFKVPVTIAAPQFSADFSQVVEQVAVEVGPQDRDLIIYVGFDEGSKS